MFKKIVTYDYYSAVDSIKATNHVPLKEGDYTMKFPDGTIVEGHIKIQATPRSVQIDMNGIPDHYTERRAYFWYDLFGTKIKIFLRDSGILVDN